MISMQKWSYVSGNMAKVSKAIKALVNYISRHGQENIETNFEIKDPRNISVGFIAIHAESDSNTKRAVQKVILALPRQNPDESEDAHQARCNHLTRIFIEEAGIAHHAYAFVIHYTDKSGKPVDPHAHIIFSAKNLTEERRLTYPEVLTMTATAKAVWENLLERNGYNIDPPKSPKVCRSAANLREKAADHPIRDLKMAERHHGAKYALTALVEKAILESRSATEFRQWFLRHGGISVRPKARDNTITFVCTRADGTVRRFNSHKLFLQETSRLFLQNWSMDMQMKPRRPALSRHAVRRMAHGWNARLISAPEVCDRIQMKTASEEDIEKIIGRRVRDAERFMRSLEEIDRPPLLMKALWLFRIFPRRQRTRPRVIFDIGG